MLDAFNLCEALKELYNETSISPASSTSEGSSTSTPEKQQGSRQAAVISSFEAEMRSRTSHAVEMSRQACFDAHSWERLNENSAVLTKRAVVAK